MPNFIDLTDQRFGRLMVLSRAPNRPNSKLTRWFCLCDCGKKIIVLAHCLRGGYTRSCKCLANELTSQRCKLGYTHLKEYKAWHSMRKRCSNKNNKDYHRYGGRGITVCEKWNKSYPDFFKDVGPAPTPKHTLDRIDNDGNYEPGNCRWATHKEQCNNRCNSRKYKRTMSLTERIKKIRELCSDMNTQIDPLLRKYLMELTC